ncbi:hypothetical protein NBT05_17320 [Aquimarina sp. ERC-38]|uniref:PulJ/GspJ family protein n=1 Tax=Aquimarina sp. ERC-38 TaxID=2949996 RepID=UPI00224587B4|nr:hypothetical protein [Aquimarina sp. ERC-38]UZO80689.1 hypothetical protein NBT05_17320 [Aquimarina sp. ERC-38]
MNSSVKAFTIMEMLINLVIMSIIMGLIYFAYSSFAQHISSYRKDIEQQNSITRMYNQLKTDLYESEKVVRTDKGFDVIFYNNRKIEYGISNKTIIRRQLQNTDTLEIQHIKIIENDFSSTLKRAVSQIKIVTQLYDENLNFSVYKYYPPNFKMKL